MRAVAHTFPNFVHSHKYDTRKQPSAWPFRQCHMATAQRMIHFREKLIIFYNSIYFFCNAFVQFNIFFCNVFVQINAGSDSLKELASWTSELLPSKNIGKNSNFLHNFRNFQAFNCKYDYLIFSPRITDWKQINKNVTTEKIV